MTRIAIAAFLLLADSAYDVDWINNVYRAAPFDYEVIHWLRIANGHTCCWGESAFRLGCDGLYFWKRAVGGERKPDCNVECGRGAEIFDLQFNGDSVISDQTPSRFDKKVRPQLPFAGLSRFTPLQNSNCRNHCRNRAQVALKLATCHPKIAPEGHQNLADSRQNGLVSFLIFAIGTLAAFLLRKY